MDRAHREVMIHGRNSGRTIVTAWNLREPNKRVELEIVVTDSGLEAGYAAETFYSATTPPAASDPAPAMTSANASDDASAATATDDDPANDEDAAAATTDAPSDETADPN